MDQYHTMDKDKYIRLKIMSLSIKLISKEKKRLMAEGEDITITIEGFK